jgi:hypothetical protein
MKPQIAPTRSIGEIIRRAIVFDFRRPENRAVKTDQLLQDALRFFKLLQERGVDFVLAGGIALLQHVEGRNTEDIDVILDASALADIPGLHVTGDDPAFARASFGEVRIDVLKGSHPLFAQVRKDFSEEREIADLQVRCATPAGLVLLKLYALPSLYRQGNFARVGLYENDVATLLREYHPALEPLLAILAKHLSEPDLVELKKIVVELQARFAHFRDGRGG